MSKIDENKITICRYQASLFSYSIRKGVSSKDFARAFANSNLSKRMNDEMFLFEAIDVPAAYDEILKGRKVRGGKIFAEQIMSWIGYMYRYICFMYDVDMKKVYSFIKPQEMFDIYDAFHSMDPELAAKKIIEAKGIDFNVNNIDLMKKYLLA